MKITSKIKSFYSHKLLILTVILLVALFLRTYKVIERFEFSHDGDLYAWFVRDVLVNKHIRLIGQQTSALGIFIGPFFYYSLIPFFLLFDMEPIGGIIPITIIGLATVASYYWVFSKVFNKQIGLIGAFLQAVLIGNVNFDRAVVPSTPTNIWIIWFFYVAVMLANGNMYVFPLLGLLAGFIWHIHVALAPAMIAIPVALFLAKKLPSRAEIIKSIIFFSIPSIPLFLFELRHNFIQLRALMSNFTTDHGGGVGFDKLERVIMMVSGNLNSIFFYPLGLPSRVNKSVLIVAVFVLGLYIYQKKYISKSALITLFVWFITVMLYFTASSTHISQYYFKNVDVISFAFISVLIYHLYKKSKRAMYIVFAFIGLLFLFNLNTLLADKKYDKGYVKKVAVVDFIKADALDKKLPCIGISYITSPGENVGFRYLFWLNDMHIVIPQKGAANYSIVIPDELAEGKDERRFGKISVIPPAEIPEAEVISKTCEGEDVNITGDLFGFTN